MPSLVHWHVKTRRDAGSHLQPHLLALGSREKEKWSRQERKLYTRVLPVLGILYMFMRWSGDFRFIDPETEAQADEIANRPKVT